MSRTRWFGIASLTLATVTSLFAGEASGQTRQLQGSTSSSMLNSGSGSGSANTGTGGTGGTGGGGVSGQAAGSGSIPSSIDTTTSLQLGPTAGFGTGFAGRGATNQGFVGASSLSPTGAGTGVVRTGPGGTGQFGTGQFGGGQFGGGQLGGGQFGGGQFGQFGQRGGFFNQGQNQGLFNQNGANQQNIGTFRPSQRIAFSHPTIAPTAISTSVATRFDKLATRGIAVSDVELVVDDKGVATIRGSAASDEDRRRAELMVRMEPGVRSVVNELTVSP